MPPPLVKRLNAEAIKAANAPDVREKLTGIGFDVVTSTPEAFQRHIASELVKWRKVAKEMGLKPG